MTEHTRISAKGEVTIPKDLCERLNWAPGTELEIEIVGGEVAIRPKTPQRERITLEEFRRRMPRYDGPPMSLEDMQRGIDEAMAERWKRKEANSR